MNIAKRQLKTPKLSRLNFKVVSVSRVSQKLIDRFRFRRAIFEVVGSLRRLNKNCRARRDLSADKEKSKILFLEPKILRFEVSCDTFCDEFENSCFNLSI